MISLANIYEKGLCNVEKSVEKAKEYYEKASEISKKVNVSDQLYQSYNFNRSKKDEKILELLLDSFESDGKLKKPKKQIVDNIIKREQNKETLKYLSENLDKIKKEVELKEKLVPEVDNTKDLENIKLVMELLENQNEKLCKTK